ncbi:F-box/WD repeat-containing protein 7-like [Tropilaelaps mercedesae]|uniref:F-box/WD repeat-containing protein 7-like n=1 Tax=Tropilaelaps mercedesae TaxID=418985 RepID=A0A1V9XG99_9ACAR|nr:F-box/WD repeat-containing protein 7-like [Tropilaelaps mercedesae]
MDINSARVEELSSLATVGREHAEAIVRARTVQQQYFRRLEDLISVSGITEDFIEVNRAHLICRPPAVSPLPARPCASLSTLSFFGSASSSPPISHGSHGQGDLFKGSPDRDEVMSLAFSVDRLFTGRCPGDEDLQRHSGGQLQTSSQHRPSGGDVDAFNNKSPSSSSANHLATAGATTANSSSSSCNVGGSSAIELAHQPQPLQPQVCGIDESSNGAAPPPPKRKSDNLATQQPHPPASKKVCVVRGRELESWLNQFDSW